ncbi:hypothetical protein GM668_30310, partial [Duganella ginsengisoli]|nr:hypothetical protein [Pseudoduganella ginsengisoli]
MTTIPSTLAPPDGHTPLRAADVANHSDSWLRQMELAQMAGMGGTGPRPHAASAPAHGAPAPDMAAARPAASVHPVLPRVRPQTPAADEPDAAAPADSDRSAPDTAAVAALPGATAQPFTPKSVQQPAAQDVADIKGSGTAAPAQVSAPAAPVAKPASGAPAAATPPDAATPSHADGAA